MTSWRAASSYRYSGVKRRSSAWLPTYASGKEDSTFCRPKNKMLRGLTHQTASTAVLINRSDVLRVAECRPGRKPKFNVPMNVWPLNEAMQTQSASYTFQTIALTLHTKLWLLLGHWLNQLCRRQNTWTLQGSKCTATSPNASLLGRS